MIPLVFTYARSTWTEMYPSFVKTSSRTSSEDSSSNESDLLTISWQASTTGGPTVPPPAPGRCARLDFQRGRTHICSGISTMDQHFFSMRCQHSIEPEGPLLQRTRSWITACRQPRILIWGCISFPIRSLMANRIIHGEVMERPQEHSHYRRMSGTRGTFIRQGISCISPDYTIKERKDSGKPMALRPELNWLQILAIL